MNKWIKKCNKLNIYHPFNVMDDIVPVNIKYKDEWILEELINYSDNISCEGIQEEDITEYKNVIKIINQMKKQNIKPIFYGKELCL